MRKQSAAHAAKARQALDDYGALPPRMRLVPFTVSTFGALGQEARTLIQQIDRRCGSSIPLSLSPHATWAAPRFAPFIRMAVGCSVRRSIAAYHLLMWESRGDDLEGLD